MQGRAAPRSWVAARGRCPADTPLLIVCFLPSSKQSNEGQASKTIKADASNFCCGILTPWHPCH